MKHCLPTLVLPLLLCSPVLAQNGAATSSSEKPVQEKTKKSPALTIHYLRLSGSYADLAEDAPGLDALLLGGGGKPKAFYDLTTGLQSFAKDKEAHTLLLDLSGGLGMNLSQVAEVERCLAKVRRAGKKMRAYVQNPGSTQLQIAALCDRVIMADMGTVDMPSLAMSVTFLKDAMDLLGIKMDVVRCGDFKGATEPYTRSAMSDHLRAHYKAMLEHMNDDVVQRIAKGRKISKEKVRDMQRQRLHSAKAALKAGLVDELVPWEGAKRTAFRKLARDDVKFKSVVATKKKAPMSIFTLMSSMMAKPSTKLKLKKDGLVVLHLSGGIVDGDKRAAGSIVSGPAASLIRQLTKSDKVKGVVVRINSPGGSATASEEVLLALKDLSAKKPVVCSMGRVAASGGYYVTCFGQPILAEQGTITGSIGVLGMKPNIGALMRRIGVKDDLVALDDSPKMMVMDQDWSVEQKAAMQTLVNDVYGRFLAHVATSRKMRVEDVTKIAGGRVWSGQQAVENGLVDKIGGLSDALTMVADKAGLSGDYNVTHLPEPASPFGALASLMGAQVRALIDTSQLALVKRTGLSRALQLLQACLEDQKPRAWAVLPETFTVR